MRGAKFSFAVLFIIFSTLSIIAQETDSGSVENWCDGGGIWDDGRCGEGSLEEQVWHWSCGWYMAQADKGTFTMDDLRENVPDCESLYPPKTCSTYKRSNADSDCDGLLDIWEIVRFGHLSQKGTDDPDNDGCDNICEQMYGTAPI